ncbi:helix-turn-helix domain-containing protein [Nocardioides speluncae]|uniref:helix-turn-helix domain-containing protein n=1 Tax=Nocardioides speluncae TaxID=2670337 RepID=UPI00137A732D|nr:helix-turn-helix transcriptional regulator [Nocardioides speluncae]
MHTTRGQAQGGNLGPQPETIVSAADLVLQLDRLRRRAARGTARRKVSLTELTERTGIPRSTVHAYLTGARMPPADRLDAIVISLGCEGKEVRQWADAAERLADTGVATEAEPGPSPAAAAALSSALARHQAALDALSAAADEVRQAAAAVERGRGAAGR